MSYDVDELFRFEETNGGYAVVWYLKADNPSITELEIPEEYNGKPVVCIEDDVFMREQYLKSVKLPKSLIEIGYNAFARCPELESVEFNSEPYIGWHAFSNCPKLAAETIVMGLVGSTDITSAIFLYDIPPELPPEGFRPDVFELLLKNDCFRDCNLQELLEQMIRENKLDLMPVAEQYGMLADAELVDELIDYAAENQRVEITAYLLELKKRKFGFEGGSGLEL